MVKLMKTYKYKLYKSDKTKHLHNQINIASGVYNHCIALHKRYYRMFGKSLHVFHLRVHINKLKKLNKYKYWKNLNSSAIEDVEDRIDRAYKLFFRNLKHGIKTAPPSFKKRIKYQSITFKQCGYKLLDGNKILIRDKVYKYSKSRGIDGKIKTLTVKRDFLGDFYIYIVTDAIDAKPASRSGNIVGFDFGLKTFLTASDGDDIESPLFFYEYQKDVRKANRNLSKKKLGSNNRRKAKHNLARLHKRLADKRNDFHWKLADDLTDKYDVMCFENLNMKGMQALWGKKIGDLSFSSFIDKLKYVASIKEKTIVFIDRYEPSSKTCSVCGYIYKDLELKERSWRCPECETLHDRDRNASYNILRAGASALGLGDISPKPRQPQQLTLDLAIPA